MPSNKILTILIICVGIVTSIYLFERNPNSTVSPTKNADIVTVNSLANTDANTNDDWKKILVGISSQNQDPTTILTNTNSTDFDETSLTSQMARDVFSRYLLIANNGGPVSSDDANKIANDTLASSQYTNSGGAVYIEKNLNVNPSGDLSVLRNYSNTLNQNLKDKLGLIKTTEEPATIIDIATKNNDENKIAELDSIIVSGKGIVSDLIQMQVPKEMVTMHLTLLNASSNLLSNIEDMRSIFVDPIKGLAGASQYNKNATDFQTALMNISIYLKQKLKA